jgi:heptosyltransferase I
VCRPLRHTECACYLCRDNVQENMLMPKPLELSETPRIVIVRLSAIGDVIHAMPVASALRKRFPKAFLTWIGAEPSAELLRGHEAIDELIVLPRRWLRSPRRIWELRRCLHAWKLDLAIDAQGLAKSAIAAWLSGARRRIGFGDQWGREGSRWLYTDRVQTKSEHTVDRTLELLRPLGIERPAVRFAVPEGDPERQAAARFLREAEINGPYAVVHSGAGWPSKRWLPERFAAVAEHLGRAWRLPVMVVWAGNEERQLAERIVAGSNGNAHLAPPRNLRELAALSRRARLFVSADSGPLHLAAAVGTPCVGLYGPFPVARHGPYGPQHRAIQKMTIQGTTWQRRRAPPEVMGSIDVASVCAACDEILGRKDK